MPAGFVSGDTLKKTITPSAAAVGAGVGAYVGIQALGELPVWVQELIKTQGSDFLVAFVLLGAMIKFAPSFVQSQEKQAVSLSGLKDAVSRMVERDTRLDEKIDVAILNQRLMVDRLEVMADRSEKERSEIRTQVTLLQEAVLQWTKNIEATKSAG